MKKIATLILAAGLVFGASTGASAIEFNAKGQWVMAFELGEGGSGVSKNRRGASTYGSGYLGALDGADTFSAEQRIRLQLDAVASESLSGTVLFEIGETQWGRSGAGNFGPGSGGALGTDGVSIEVKSAYIDWMVPNTGLKIRMGLQGIALPSYTFNSSQILNDDVAAIAASYQFNDNVGMTFVWARPFNDNYGGNGGNVPANMLDNMDIFALIVPMSFNNVKVAPWFMYSAIGQNVNPGAAAGARLFPIISRDIIGQAPVRQGALDGYAYASVWWLGLTGEVAAGNGLRFAWDANYGSLSNGVGSMDREGWYLDALVEYKMAWGTPGLYAWYGSGDDGSIKNGSERMPSISPTGNDERSNLAGSGNIYTGRENAIGSQWTGTWGVGARLKDMSFMEDLKHTLRVNYIMGTNSTSMAKYILGEKDGNYSRFINPNTGLAGFNTASGKYMTTVDSALEVGLTNTYKIYDNLTMYADLNYIFMFMDEKLWGRGGLSATNGGALFNDVSMTDPWNINVSFVYQF